MDTIVTARIPVEKKERAIPILEGLGSSTTKLINAAFDFLIATGSLPQASAPSDVRASDSADAVEQFLEASTVDVPASFWKDLGERSYKDFIAEGRLADYEALA